MKTLFATKIVKFENKKHLHVANSIRERFKLI